MQFIMKKQAEERGGKKTQNLHNNSFLLYKRQRMQVYLTQLQHLERLDKISKYKLSHAKKRQTKFPGNKCIFKES